MLAAVVFGGMIGVALRALVLLPFPADPRGLSELIALAAATLLVNIAGSFGLGLLVGGLKDRRPALRMFLGTGVLGGFTTYSAFAVQTTALLAVAPVAGVALAVVSVTAGFAAAALGLRLADGRSRAHAEPADGRGGSA